VRQIVAGAAVKLDLLAILSRDNAEAIVLDLVQPLAAGRWLWG
jgi:hypothetical protein